MDRLPTFGVKLPDFFRQHILKFLILGHRVHLLDQCLVNALRLIVIVKKEETLHPFLIGLFCLSFIFKDSFQLF